MANSRVFNRFVGSKVVVVGSKKYTSLEKIYPILNSDKIIVTLREVELKENVYNHPIKGNVYSYQFRVVNNSTKVYITIGEWENLEDINIKKYNIDIK